MVQACGHMEAEQLNFMIQILVSSSPQRKSLGGVETEFW